MNEYETFKKWVKWVNSFDEKIYYKIKPPTKKELYEITIKQEEEIERLTKENINLKEQIKVMEELSKKYVEVIEMLQRGDKE